MHSDLAPHNLLAAYAHGVFPMADDEGMLHWLSPDPRAIIELDAVRIPRTLRATLRRRDFQITINRAFGEVIAACADRAEGTWISSDVVAAYRALHALGFAHSVEAWQADHLAGGLYGVALGGAFFGESMFRRASDASKVALVALVQRMRARGFTLLDVQFMTEHLRRFGAVEIPQHVYLRRLRHALQLDRSFVEAAEEPAPEAADEQDA